MQQITEEQLKNMGPEEIAEFQKQNCIFCHILAGRAASKKVYEEKNCIAILDINPANPGHVLVIPNEHYSIMPQMPENAVKEIAVSAKKVSLTILKAFKAEGTNLFVANGVYAGQKAQHFMIHVIPRKTGDNVSGFVIPKKFVDEKDAVELTELTKKIRQSIDNLPKSAEYEEIEEKNPETKEEKKEEIKEKNKEGKEEKKASALDDIASLFK